MGNRVTVQPTKFINFPQISTEDETLGVRVYDDHGQSYINGWDEFPETNEEILRKVRDHADEVICAMLDFALEHGLYLGSDWLEASEVQEILE